MKNIDDILKELLSIDPSFAEHQDELRTLISKLLEKKPDTRLDEEFVARLRAQLMGVPTPSPFARYFAYVPYVVAVLAVLVALPYGVQYLQQGSGTPVFAMNQQIQSVGKNAYGSIASTEMAHRDLGGAGSTSNSAAEAAYAPQSPENNAAAGDTAVSAASAPAPAVVTKMATGMGGGASGRMMYPVGPVTVYSYVYKGEPLELPENGDVYSRTKGQNSGIQIAGQLKKFNFGLLNMNAFSDMSLRSFELAENKPFGYIVDASFTEGTISINADYTQWPSLNGKNGEIQPLAMSAMPKDNELIAVAKQFLDSHGIDLANYADPIVQQYTDSLASADSATQYAPDQITVVYPLKISGTQVYEDGAYPYGLQVAVSVRDKKVVSVYGLTSQTYTSSSYKLEANSDKILSVLEKGGPHSWAPQESDGVQVKKVDVEVGTPTKVLMHTYNYKDNESQELFVPALMFPVTKAPAGDEYYPKNIIIPLVPELLDQAQTGPVPYDAVRH